MSTRIPELFPKVDFSVDHIRQHLVKVREDMERFGASYTVGTVNIDYLEHLLSLIGDDKSHDEIEPFTTNPLERIIEGALISAKIPYKTEHDAENTATLDFYLPRQDIYIEVKTMHSDRIAEQMSRARSVIVAQGRISVEWLADLIRGRRNGRTR